MPRQLMRIEQVLSILQETPGRLTVLTEGATEAQLHTSPEPDEWSVTEILAHLRACADMWGGAIGTIVATDHPTIRTVNPTTWIESTDYHDLGYSPSLQAFTKQRDRLLVLLGQLSKQDWSRRATVLGAGKPLKWTVHSYADRLARHERTHWRQLAKAVRPLLSD